MESQQNQQSYLSDIANIYKQISIETDIYFDEIDEKNYLVKCIQNTFDKNFLLIETSILIGDSNKLNISFVTLIKYCKNQQRPYNKVHKIFIEYCDYFDLPYNKCFLLLHEKLQLIIKNQTMSLIGKNKFKKIDKINNPNKMFNLFDLVK